MIYIYIYIYIYKWLISTNNERDTCKSKTKYGIDSIIFKEMQISQTLPLLTEMGNSSSSCMFKSNIKKRLWHGLSMGNLPPFKVFMQNLDILCMRMLKHVFCIALLFCTRCVLLFWCYGMTTLGFRFVMTTFVIVNETWKAKGCRMPEYPA